jgi:succinate dehydrogenase flavin-adding protein (antitoxin of CptAB toxin-antitoxin module)
MGYTDFPVLGGGRMIQHPERIRWACRRGMLELDILLLGFYDGTYADLPEPLQQQFLTLLESADQDLNKWLLSYENAPESLRPICQCIRDFHLRHSS